jgi:O-acetyl-ADP-ribose deacetylase (regulator of RNase III)
VSAELFLKPPEHRNCKKACDKLAPIKTGEAVITPGFALPAKYVIHAAGPVYSHYSPEQSEELLRSAYMKSLELAVKKKCGSIAFPLISSGITDIRKMKP